MLVNGATSILVLTGGLYYAVGTVDNYVSLTPQLI